MSLDAYAALAIPLFVLGVSVGSFLNVVADRVSAGRSLVRPRSACLSCNHPLSNRDLIPIISYLSLRGRCRYCGAGISARLLFVEVAEGLLFAGVFLRFGLGAEFFVLSTAGSLLLVVAVIDLEHHLILDRIVFPSMAVLLVLAPFWPHLGFSRTFLSASGMAASLANSLVAGATGFAVFLLIFLAYPQGMGGGDVKYAGLLGPMLGIPGVLLALYGAVVSGGLVAILLLALRKKGRKDQLPFGVFMSLGAFVVLVAGDDILAAYHDVVGAVRDL